MKRVGGDILPVLHLRLRTVGVGEGKLLHQSLLTVLHLHTRKADQRESILALCRDVPTPAVLVDYGKCVVESEDA